jgi:hypothetical protein
MDLLAIGFLVAVALLVAVFLYGTRFDPPER